MLWSIIVGALIGVIAGAITNKGGSMGGLLISWQVLSVQL